MKNALLLIALIVALAGCDETTDEPDAMAGTDGGGDVDAARRDSGNTDAGDRDGGSRDADGIDAGDFDSGPGPSCDYQTVAGMIVIEAENLAINENWAVASDTGMFDGFTGAGYIQWEGPAFNNDPSQGVIDTAVRFTAAGLYRLQWHTRVGMGADSTEHNDTWVSFPDAADFYGSQGSLTAEDRVYPRPTCDDSTFMGMIRAMPNVAEATCPVGSTRDGFFKVYSSGAVAAWRWSAFTSDSDAHTVIIQIDSPGVYTFRIAARANFSLIDRIVIHEMSIDDSTVRDLANAETPCP